MTTGAQDAVERMIAQGAPFECIEQYIELLPLSSEQLSALWLLAWAEATDPITRRQIVGAALADCEKLPGSARVPAPEPSCLAHSRRTGSYV